MKCNIGVVEKSVRALIGLPLVAGGFYMRHYSNVFSQVFLWLGLWLLFTAAFAWCPFSWLLHREKTKS